ncbi:MAG TPA: tetratricopeptide repeat protein, partial [Polyangiales bacterium]|nr:tetratricopeptide repeat protein [Polyangiales bacterium]
MALALVWSATALPQMAAAQGRGSGEDAEYRSVIEEALAEFNRGNWEEAAALFERAHRLNPSARTLRGMGLTAYEARRYVDATRHLSEALTETRRPLTPQQREEVTQTLDRARRFIAHLRLRIGPASARVTINGREAEPDAKGDVATDPGLLDVEISADGYET